MDPAKRSLRTRWLVWRARFSIPTLLSRADEHKVISIVTAFNGALAIVTLSLVACLSELPLVFPALGPTAFILFSAPFSRAAAPRSVVLGHLIGASSGYLAWHCVRILGGVSVTWHLAGWPAVLSAGLALGISGLLLVRLSCPHAPACASALIVALGGVQDFRGVLVMMGAVIVLTAQAVTVNRLASLPVPLWTPRRRVAV